MYVICLNMKAASVSGKVAVLLGAFLFICILHSAVLQLIKSPRITIGA